MKSSLPLELQFMIIEYTPHSQHPTLRLVCKTWKSAVFRIFKRRYCEPFIPTQEWLTENPHKWASNQAIEPEKAPFLLHRFFTEFKGYCRGVLAPEQHPTNSGFTCRLHILPDAYNPWEKYFVRDPFSLEANAAIKQATREYLEYATDPIIIPNTDDWHDVPAPGEITFSYECDHSSDFSRVPTNSADDRNVYIYYHTERFVLKPKNTPLVSGKTLSIRWFLGWYIMHHAQRLRSVPNQREDFCPSQHKFVNGIRFPTRTLRDVRLPEGEVVEYGRAGEYDVDIFWQSPSLWKAEERLRKKDKDGKERNL